MKKKILAVLFLLFIVWCGIAFSKTCYSVEGTVNTINLSEEVQQGIINLQLFDEDDNDREPVFDETGDIVGIVTDSSTQGVTYLIHTATFEDGSKFVTYQDEASIINPWNIKWAEDGSPCYIEVSELIRKIVKGKGFFKNVSSDSDGMAVKANGYINTCGSDNENIFELTGKICFE